MKMKGAINMKRGEMGKCLKNLLRSLPGIIKRNNRVYRNPRHGKDRHTPANI